MTGRVRAESHPAPELVRRPRPWSGGRHLRNRVHPPVPGGPLHALPAAARFRATGPLPRDYRCPYRYDTARRPVSAGWLSTRDLGDDVPRLDVCAMLPRGEFDDEQRIWAAVRWANNGGSNIGGYQLDLHVRPDLVGPRPTTEQPVTVSGRLTGPQRSGFRTPTAAQAGPPRRGHGASRSPIVVEGVLGDLVVGCGVVPVLSARRGIVDSSLLGGDVIDGLANRLESGQREIEVRTWRGCSQGKRKRCHEWILSDVSAGHGPSDA